MNTVLQAVTEGNKVPNPERFHLFPHDCPGKTNVRYVEFLTNAHRHFSMRGDYVGLSAYGSQLTGVTSATSDFDIILIAGDSMCTTENLLQSEISHLAQPFRRSGNSPHVCSYNFFRNNFDVPDHSTYVYHHAAWPLAYPLIGDTERIQELRSKLRKRHLGHKRVHPSRAEKNLADAVWCLLYWELGLHVKMQENGLQVQYEEVVSKTFRKISSRGHSPKEIHQAIISRWSFWMKRMRKLFGEDIPTMSV